MIHGEMLRESLKNYFEVNIKLWKLIFMTLKENKRKNRNYRILFYFFSLTTLSIGDYVSFKVVGHNNL